MKHTDPRGLQRFVTAQDHSFDEAIAEMRKGRKVSHWMWFVFPQIAGLGRSAMAEHYAIRSIEEARAYLAHPLLGERLREAVAALTSSGRSVATIFGPVDAIKLRSSLTLFEIAADDPAPYRAALDQLFAGERDAATLVRL